MTRALARGICENDPDNPAVARLASDVNARLWAAQHLQARRPSFGEKVRNKLHRAVRQADAEVIDALHWREEIKAWIASHISENELQDALARASCVDGPRSIQAFIQGFPESFVVEIDESASPVRLKLRDRIRRADEERRRSFVAAAVKRYGPLVAGAALGATGTAEVAHLLDLTDLEKAVPIFLGGYLSAEAAKGAANARRRNKLQTTAADWIRRCRATLDSSVADRAGLLEDLRKRLIVRSERLYDMELVETFEDIEDALIRLEQGQGDTEELLHMLDQAERLMRQDRPAGPAGE